MAKNFDIPADKVIVHTTFLGGSYGRKYVPDFVLHAARWSLPEGGTRPCWIPSTGRGGAFKTYVAHVVEVEIVKGAPAVRRVVCAVDAGTIINPGLVKANIEGGIGFALTNTLKSEITFANGVVEQSNFHDYPLLGLSEMPAVEVVLIDSDRPPQGCGEVSLAPVAPPSRMRFIVGPKRA
jgi:isoquinoline 1-oxidoreductase subunit beta